MGGLEEAGLVRGSQKKTTLGRVVGDANKLGDGGHNLEGLKNGGGKPGELDDANSNAGGP